VGRLLDRVRLGIAGRGHQDLQFRRAAGLLLGRGLLVVEAAAAGGGGQEHGGRGGDREFLHDRGSFRMTKVGLSNAWDSVGRPDRRSVSISTQRAAASASGWPRLVSPMAAATGVSSNPTTARVTWTAPSAPASLTQTRAVAPRSTSSSAAALPSAGELSVSRARSVSSPAADSVLNQPALRSSPTPEPCSQPMKPIRRWPASSRWRVAASVPAAPSTSTQGYPAS